MSLSLKLLEKIMEKENAFLLEGDSYLNVDFDFEELEKTLESELVDSFSDLEMLKEEKNSIGNPDSLGKVVMDEIWSQFANQIGLDMTNETLIQKYDREHPETYDEVSKKVLQDKKFKEKSKELKLQQQEGTLKDAYTGKDLTQNERMNVDHVESRKEIYENKRRKQAGLQTEELANMDENLVATNESLNKSKGKKSVDEFIETREQREADLRKQNEAANKKIDESNMSEAEKKIAIAVSYTHLTLPTKA